VGSSNKNHGQAKATKFELTDAEKELLMIANENSYKIKENESNASDQSSPS
jgi:hypothetical protein